jgi:predicted Fe-S protein YdhL (DUF1289 family)
MIDSPCVNVCQMSPEHRLCVGCLRTLDEIARWSVMRDEERVRVVAAAAARRALLGPISAAPQSVASAGEVVPADADRYPNRR